MNKLDTAIAAWDEHLTTCTNAAEGSAHRLACQIGATLYGAMVEAARPAPDPRPRAYTYIEDAVWAPSH